MSRKWVSQVRRLSENLKGYPTKNLPLVSLRDVVSLDLRQEFRPSPSWSLVKDDVWGTPTMFVTGVRREVSVPSVLNDEDGISKFLESPSVRSSVLDILNKNNLPSPS